MIRVFPILAPRVQAAALFGLNRMERQAVFELEAPARPRGLNEALDLIAVRLERLREANRKAGLPVSELLPPEEGRALPEPVIMTALLEYMPPLSHWPAQPLPYTDEGSHVLRFIRGLRVTMAEALDIFERAKRGAKGRRPSVVYNYRTCLWQGRFFDGTDVSLGRIEPAEDPAVSLVDFLDGLDDELPPMPYRQIFELQDQAWALAKDEAWSDEAKAVLRRVMYLPEL